MVKIQFTFIFYIILAFFIFSAVFILIGSIIFGSRVDSIPSTVNLAHYLYVPYYFNIVCGVLSALAGACMLKYKVEYSSWFWNHDTWGDDFAISIAASIWTAVYFPPNIYRNRRGY